MSSHNILPGQSTEAVDFVTLGFHVSNAQTNRMAVSIAGNYTRDINVSDVAAVAGMQPNSALRLFRQTCGLTVLADIIGPDSLLYYLRPDNTRLAEVLPQRQRTAAMTSAEIVTQRPGLVHGFLFFSLKAHETRHDPCHCHN